MKFLRSSEGAIPGGTVAEKILMIGVPKPATKLPYCIADPAQLESCLLVLAELDGPANEYLVCPGANKYCPGRMVEKSPTFYSDCIRTMTLREQQLVSVYDPSSSAPRSLQEFNNRQALKLTMARANCIVEIHRAEIEERDTNFADFVGEHVSDWPLEYIAPGMKMLLVWQDDNGRKHVSICPCITELVRYCSGATSALPTTCSLRGSGERPLCEQ